MRQRVARVKLVKTEEVGEGSFRAKRLTGGAEEMKGSSARR